MKANLQKDIDSGNIIYVSDPSSLASRYLPDPATEESLRALINEMASAGVDLFIQEAYTQGWTTYWRTEGFDYDARPQHRRFLPLLDQGKQPLEILLDQCHKHNIRFAAGFRMNDNHGAVSTAQGVGAGAEFIVNNPQLQLSEAPPGANYQETTPLDFSNEEVRAFILSVVKRLIETFEVDGIEMCFRDQRYFPPDTGRERAHLLTDLVAQIRSALDNESGPGGQRRLLGAHVFATIEECQYLGLDVPTWIEQGLVDYISPADCMYAEFNLPYQEWSMLTSGSNCQFYPSMMPWTSNIARYRTGQQPMDQDQQRALAHTMYSQGANGISLYNHFEIMHGAGGAHAPFYPLALHDSHHLRSDKQTLNGRRHYVFDATWGGYSGFLPDRTSTGALKAQRAILERPQGEDEYTFNIFEDISQSAAQLLFRGYHMTMQDHLEIKLNGHVLADTDFKRRDDEVRLDLRPETYTHDVYGPIAGEALSSEKRSCVTYWFPLTEQLSEYGTNRLSLRLIYSDPTATKSIIVEEVEVFVVPKPSFPQ